MAGEIAEVTTKRPALRPLDEAVEYIRNHGAAVFPLYVAAVAPMTIAVYMLLDAASTGMYSALPEGCLLLTVATVWKWAWASAIQGRIQSALSGKPMAPLLGRLSYIICLKLAASVAMLWGSLIIKFAASVALLWGPFIIIIPAIYGFFLSGMAVPLLLDGSLSPLAAAIWTVKWVGDSISRVVKITTAIGLLFLVAYVGVSLLQLLATQMIMPSLLGIDTSELSLILSGATWQMAVVFMLFLAFDFFWTVAAALLYHDIQSGRAGVDLGLRLTALEG
ncbi:MAG: hypothetical protein OEY50_08875 [Nitrospinota bacterium]|nr:hypothetical protein [Nitrospinota bacterium]